MAEAQAAKCYYSPWAVNLMKNKEEVPGTNMISLYPKQLSYNWIEEY